MIKAIFFDLDGTLLRMSLDSFRNHYFQILVEKGYQLGFKDKQKFGECMFAGIKRMTDNDGSKLNEEVFWDCFAEYFGKDSLIYKKDFDAFYKDEFTCLKEYAEENKYAKDIINFIKSKNLMTVLATNPYFPVSGQETRINFIPLSYSDFDYVTAYSNSTYCKPNVKYFKEVMNKLSLKSDEIIYFGNDVKEDFLPATSLGIKTYLVKGYILYHDIDVSSLKDYEEIEMSDVILKIKSHL